MGHHILVILGPLEAVREARRLVGVGSLYRIADDIAALPLDDEVYDACQARYREREPATPSVWLGNSSKISNLLKESSAVGLRRDGLQWWNGWPERDGVRSRSEDLR